MFFDITLLALEIWVTYAEIDVKCGFDEDRIKYKGIWTTGKKKWIHYDPNKTYDLDKEHGSMLLRDCLVAWMAIHVGVILKWIYKFRAHCTGKESVIAKCMLSDC